ncbi:MAG TPA: complex I NDUFA9 subunit family protein [Anaerolineae bacterium]|nr:complex I NDUFA9 subunit family protein [Anaerolineae bacterium]
MNILITGISGFVGSHLAARLVAEGHTVRGLVRWTDARGHLAPQVNAELVVGDITKLETLPRAMVGMDAVVHLVAIPYERGKATYEAINAQGTRNVVQAAQVSGVKRFVHQSALAADSQSPYAYLKSKGEGEDAVRASSMDWTIFRPSVLVGPEDEFANALARWLVITPLVFPLVGDGQARFQPLWIEDMVTMMSAVLNRPDTSEQTYEVGGPEYLTYEAMVKQILVALQRNRLLIKVPIPLMRPIIKVMEVVLPKPPATTSLLDLLNVDNTTTLDGVQRNFGFPPRRFADVISDMRRYTFSQALHEALRRE